MSLRSGILSRISIAIGAIVREVVVMLPDEFSSIRRKYYNRCGCAIANTVSISPNVRIRGYVQMGEFSSVAQNSTISGMSSGVRIGKHVMIGPNVTIVAFDHVSSSRSVPMRCQGNTEAEVYIGDDVWIGANTTLLKGARLGNGVIVGANSVVRGDIPDYSIVCGVPARVIKSRAE